MSSTTQLFLDRTYSIDGVEITGAEIKDMMIDNFIMKKHLQGDGK